MRPGHRRNGTAPTPAAMLPRGVLVLLGFACLVVVVAGLRWVSDLVGPVFLGLMLVVTVSPLTDWLRRRKVPGWLAALATVLVIYAILVALGGALVLSIAELVDLMPTYAQQFSELRDSIVSGLGTLGVSADQVRSAVEGANPTSVVDAIAWLFGSLASVFTNTLFLAAVVLFMCLDAVEFPARLRIVVGERPQVVSALRSFASGTRRYLVVCTVFGLIVAVFDTLLLWALDVPLPLLWGLLSFITNYIPNIGFVIGVIPPALLGLLQGGPELMITVIVLYCLVNFIIQSVIQPKVVGDAVGLSTTISFLALIFWAWVLGGLGALLAIPLTLLAKGLLVDIDPSTRWMNVLLSDSPAQDEAPATPAPQP
ncbi:AI-2E family transporter [Actinoplanes ianthinogenes]|uniref:AI-2E family transporter n=1 Tax=Actinoplanes ianthinogenes TaxID=122358 RepID=A0ABM7M2A8_9ACTN|nr:AI-2E family transporter [Actinoplanes ianthinogenes]GGR32211.1 AI-2E family transporter [Actinoplanes ianthinogenes]